MVQGGDGGATGGRHRAGGLHSRRLLLLVGTEVSERVAYGPRLIWKDFHAEGGGGAAVATTCYGGVDCR